MKIISNITGESTESPDVRMPKGGLGVNGQRRGWCFNANDVYFFNDKAMVKIPQAELWRFIESIEPKLKLVISKPDDSVPEGSDDQKP